MTCCDWDKPLTPEELRRGEDKLLVLIQLFEDGMIEPEVLTDREEDEAYTVRLFEEQYRKESLAIANRKDIHLIEKCLLDIELTAKWEQKAKEWELDSMVKMLHCHWHMAQDRLKMAQTM